MCIRDRSSSKYYGDYSFGFSNGSPEMRLEAISACINDSEVDCLLAARGAAGSSEIIMDVAYLFFIPI